MYLVSRVVRGDQAGPGARLDRHVADRHAPGHGQAAHHLARVLDHVAGAARGADLADDREDHVLGGDAERQLAVDRDAHVLRPLLQQGLGGQHVLDLGGADAEGERAERAMRRGMGVAADDGHAGQGEALLGADDVHDALANVVDVEQRDAELAAVLLQGLDLDARLLFGDALRTIGGRHVVVGDRQGGVGAAHRATALAQALERLRARHLVHQMTVDVQQAGAVVLLVDQVRLPDLVEQGLGLGHDASASLARPPVGTPRRPERRPLSYSAASGVSLASCVSVASCLSATLAVRPRSSRFS